MSKRELELGPSLRLVFENRQIIRDRMQQLWRSPESREAATRAAPGGGTPQQIPDSEVLLASMSLQSGNSQPGEAAPSCLAELEHRVYAEVEGHGRCFACIETNPVLGTSDTTSPCNVLRFEFSAAQIAALRAGADFGFGIDDDRMRVGAMVKRELRACLLADLD